MFLLTEKLTAPDSPTILLVQAVFFCLAWLGLARLLRFLRLRDVRRGELRLLCASVFLTLFLLEAAFHLFGLQRTQTEALQGRRHVDLTFKPGSFSTRPPDADHFFTGPEFSYPRHTNSLGFSDREWPLKKTKFRVLALGDSFTEGDGAPAEATWVALIRKKFDGAAIPADWMNAGLCASDPFFEYKLLRERLQAYAPDLVVVATQDQDYAEDMLRLGGTARWNNSDRRDISFLEAAYAYSRLARLFMEKVLGYDENLVKRDAAAMKKVKDKYIPEALDLYAGYAREQRARVLFVYFPDQSAVQRGSYQYGFEEVLSAGAAARSGLGFYDLLPCYRARISASGRPAADFWWPKNRHHNSDGYELMASCIFEAVRPLAAGRSQK